MLALPPAQASGWYSAKGNWRLAVKGCRGHPERALDGQMLIAKC
jgi:hypothetical protein